MKAETVEPFDGTHPSFSPAAADEGSREPSRAMFFITPSDASGVGVLTVHGILDERNARALDSALFISFGAGHHMVVNLQNVTFLGPACLRLFCKAHRTAVYRKTRLSVIHGILRFSTGTLTEHEAFRRETCIRSGERPCIWIPGPGPASSAAGPAMF